MAPSAACGKAFFLILVCVIKLAVGLAVRRWRAESRRRIQQAAAVGLTFGQIDVYTILIHRALKDNSEGIGHEGSECGESGYEERFASQTNELKAIDMARDFYPHFPTFYVALERHNALLNDFYYDHSLGSITRDQVDRFHNDLGASIRELSMLASYDPGVKDNPLLNCITSIREGFSDVAHNFVETFRGHQRDNPVYASFFERASNLNIFGGNFTTYIHDPGVRQELASIRRLLYIQFGFLFA